MRKTDDRPDPLPGQRETAERALAALAEHGLTPSPENYRLW